MGESSSSGWVVWVGGILVALAACNAAGYAASNPSPTATERTIRTTTTAVPRAGVAGVGGVSTPATTATAAPVAVATTAPPTAQPSAVPQQEPEDKIDCNQVACLALTFDDGPGADTEKIVHAFSATGTKATFFVIGRNAVNFPKELHAINDAGMEIGNHTQNHVDLMKISTAGGAHDIEACSVNVNAIIGRRPTLMRPPYGSFGAGSAYGGYPVILWNNDTQDWLTKNSATTQERAVAGARPGGIVLMHEIDSTAVAVPEIIKELRGQGYRLVTVSKLLEHPQPGGLYRQRG